MVFGLLKRDSHCRNDGDETENGCFPSFGLFVVLGVPRGDRLSDTSTVLQVLGVHHDSQTQGLYREAVDRFGQVV